MNEWMKKTISQNQKVMKKNPTDLKCVRVCACEKLQTISKFPFHVCVWVCVCACKSVCFIVARSFKDLLSNCIVITRMAEKRVTSKQANKRTTQIITIKFICFIYCEFFRYILLAPRSAHLHKRFCVSAPAPARAHMRHSFCLPIFQFTDLGD